MSKGIFAAIAAAFSAGILPIFTKLMMNLGATSGQVLFYRYLFVFLIMGFWHLTTRKTVKIRWTVFLTLIFFSIAGYGGACFLLTCSFNFLPVSLATMLYFTYPLFVMMIMVVIFREKPSVVKITALLLAVAGIFCLMDFTLNIANIGSLLAIGAGFAYSLYLVGLQKSKMADLPATTIIFYLAGISTVFFGIQAYTADGSLAVSLPAVGCGLILGGITVFVLSMVALATRLIGSTKTSLIIAFESVVSLVMGILVFSEPYTMGTWIGAAFMTASVILVSVKKEKNEEDAYDDRLYTTHSSE